MTYISAVRSREGDQRVHPTQGTTDSSLFVKFRGSSRPSMACIVHGASLHEDVDIWESFHVKYDGGRIREF